MKKLVIVALVAFFAATGLAVAGDISVSGDFSVRGQFLDNSGSGLGTQAGTAAASYGVWDSDMHINTTYMIDDNTKVATTFSLLDDGAADDNVDGALDEEDTLEIERMYGWHKFSNGLEITTGFVSGGGWGGIAFGDTVDAKFRVILGIPASFGKVLALAEKVSEGSSTYADGDADLYAVGILSKIGDIDVRPLFVYVDKESTKEQDWVFDLALLGSFGNIGWEAEYAIKKQDFDTANDVTYWGAYGNIWLTMDALKIGALIAYSGEDGGYAYNTGADFDAGGAVVMADYLTLGTGTTSAEMQDGTLLAAYADYAVNDAWSVGAYLGYFDSGNDTAGGSWNGASVTEISGDVTWKISDNLKYVVAAGLATIDYGFGTDPDDAIRIYHKLAFTF